MNDRPTRAAGWRGSRRALIRGGVAGAAGLVGTVLIGCDESDASPGTTAPPSTPVPTGTSTPDPSATEPPAGGTLRDAGLGAIAGIDPHNALYHGAGIARQAYVNLIRTEMLRPDLGLHHDLAESFEVPDETTAVFQLRRDALIHANDHGVPERAMDAEDVVVSFDRISDPANAANGAPFFARWIEGCEATDAYSVRVTTTRPYAWLLALLGDALQAAIVPREFLDLGRDVFQDDAVGAGPFALQSAIEGQEYTMRRHPGFYADGRPRLDGLRRVIFQDPGTMRAAFQDGQIDRWVTPNVEEARAVADQLDTVTHVEHASIAYNSFWMRVDAAPWDDERVRRAVNRALDRDEYVELIGRGAGAPMGPLSPAFAEYVLGDDELTALQPFDPEEARSLFEAAGVDALEFVFPAAEGIADYVEILVRQLAAAGVTAQPLPLDAQTWMAGYFQAAHEASLSMNQSYKTPEHALLWYQTGGPTGGGQFDTGFSSEALDSLLGAAAATLDDDERIELYREAQREILDSNPAFLNIFNHRMNTLHGNHVHGLSPGPGHMGEFLYRQAWIDDVV